MVGDYPVVTLCGSTKFKDQFIESQKKLTLAGFIVISPCYFEHSGDTLSELQKYVITDMHMRKIDMSDMIYVINVGGYIGEGTKAEIEYAKEHNKKIIYLE